MEMERGIVGNAENGVGFACAFGKAPADVSVINTLTLSYSYATLSGAPEGMTWSSLQK